MPSPYRICAVRSYVGTKFSGPLILELKSEDMLLFEFQRIPYCIFIGVAKAIGYPKEYNPAIAAHPGVACYPSGV